MIYILMATANGKDYTYCLDSQGNIISDDFLRPMKYKREQTYQRLREEAKRLHIKHIPRKNFKIVEFTIKENG